MSFDGVRVSTPWQVVLRREALPDDEMNELEKKLQDQGADLLFMAGRGNASIDLLLRNAETMQRCNAYAIQTRVFAHSLHQVRAQGPHAARTRMRCQRGLQGIHLHLFFGLDA